ncbi:MAG: aminotransferase class III-fold pyridoxal phosphate-dependent enzyme, partial [Erysipelotrichaceae bacterium]|nr:aminotransferase class III-fold pyridoxal phosphate-dependent enzyme [Erysipelotrichaceae bacterium]
MDFETLKAADQEYILPTYGRFDLALDHGQGALVYDINGKKYIDMTSGIGVLSLGQNHPALV